MALENKVDAAKRQLAELNATIKEREQYHNEQEKLINELVQRGSSELQGLEYEIKEAKHTLKQAKQDMRLTIQDKQQAEIDLELVHKQIREELGVPATA